MFKKIKLAALATTILSLSTSALASGFYAGPSIAIQDVITSSSGYRSLTPKITLGYDVLGDGSYFSAEIFGIPGSFSLTDTHLPGTASAKMSRGFGLSFIPGMVIGPQTVGFFRIGLVTTFFTSPGSYKTGAQLGLGLMTSVSPNWDVRGEYDYSMYGTVGSVGAPKVDEFALAFLYRLDWAE